MEGVGGGRGRALERRHRGSIPSRIWHSTGGSFRATGCRCRRRPLSLSLSLSLSLPLRPCPLPPPLFLAYSLSDRLTPCVEPHVGLTSAMFSPAQDRPERGWDRAANGLCCILVRYLLPFGPRTLFVMILTKLTPAAATVCQVRAATTPRASMSRELLAGRLNQAKVDRRGIYIFRWQPYGRIRG